MKAKNREQYVNEWRAHVRQLIHPYLDSSRPHTEYESMRDRLYIVIDEAADQVFQEEVTT